MLYPLAIHAMLTRKFRGLSSNISFTRDILGTTVAVVGRSRTKPVLDTDDKARGSIHSHVFLLSCSESAGLSPGQGDAAISEPSLNIYDLPLADRTLRLIHGYFDNIGLLFRYIHHNSFIQAYREAVSTNLRNMQQTWLGMLNIILALSINVSYPSELSQHQRVAKSKVFF